MKHVTALSLVLCTLLANQLFAADPVEIKLPAKEKFHIFILAGQSNMAGRGDTTKEDKVPHPRVLVLGKDGHWKPAVDPLHWDKGGAGVGPGRTFAITVAEANPDVVIGLVPTACGGSPISSWQPGGFHGQTKSHPYDDCLQRSKRALEDGTLKAILWHQGESDSNVKLAEVYETKLNELIARFRKEFNAPELPFIIGQLGQFRAWGEGLKVVDAAHQNIARQDPHAAFVSSTGLGHKGDNLHFSGDAQREFGRRYAAAYSELLKSSATEK